VIDTLDQQQIGCNTSAAGVTARKRSGRLAPKQSRGDQAAFADAGYVDVGVDAQKVQDLQR
jgi:hypothetical protein